MFFILNLNIVIYNKIIDYYILYIKKYYILYIKGFLKL